MRRLAMWILLMMFSTSGILLASEGYPWWLHKFNNPTAGYIQVESSYATNLTSTIVRMYGSIITNMTTDGRTTTVYFSSVWTNDMTNVLAWMQGSTNDITNSVLWYRASTNDITNSWVWLRDNTNNVTQSTNKAWDIALHTNDYLWSTQKVVDIIGNTNNFTWGTNKIVEILGYTNGWSFTTNWITANSNAIVVSTNKVWDIAFNTNNYTIVTNAWTSISNSLMTNLHVTESTAASSFIITGRWGYLNVKTNAGGGGGGDVYLANTNVFTGVTNLFEGDIVATNMIKATNVTAESITLAGDNRTVWPTGGSGITNNVLGFTNNTAWHTNINVNGTANIATAAVTQVVGNRSVWGTGVSIADIGAGSSGSFQHGDNNGTWKIGSGVYGAGQMGYLMGGSAATNNGAGSLQLLYLSGQSALMLARASLSLGANTNIQHRSITVGDGAVSYAEDSISVSTGGIFSAGPITIGNNQVVTNALIDIGNTDIITNNVVGLTNTTAWHTNVNINGTATIRTNNVVVLNMSSNINLGGNSLTNGNYIGNLFYGTNVNATNLAGTVAIANMHSDVATNGYNFTRAITVSNNLVVTNALTDVGTTDILTNMFTGTSVTFWATAATATNVFSSTNITRKLYVNATNQDANIFGEISGMFRVLSNAYAAIAYPTTGAGLESYYSGNIGYMSSYDRAAGVYRPFQMRGLTIDLYAGAYDIASLSMTGLALIRGTVLAPTGSFSVANITNLNVNGTANVVAGIFTEVTLDGVARTTWPSGGAGISSGDPDSGIWGLSMGMDLEPLQYVQAWTAGLWRVNFDGSVSPSTNVWGDTLWITNASGIIPR